MYRYPESFDFYGQGIDGALGGMIGGAVGVLAVLAVIWFIIGFLSVAYSVTMYIFHSLGLYTIAQRRGIHRPWMAWVPVTNMWILGSISDQYQYVTKGKVCNRRKLLLGLDIAGYAVTAVVYIAYFVLLIKMAGGAINGDLFSGFNPASFLVIMLFGLAITGLAIVALVFRYIAYYDLFQSCNPGNATAYLVLSIVFPFLLPIFVFCCRKKEQGMPPRKSQYTPPVYQPAPQPTYQPTYEPAPATENPEVVEAQDEDFAE